MQTMIVLLIIAILVGIAMSNVLDYSKRSRGMACGNNLRNIEAAKAAWIRTYPENPQIPSEAELKKWLKGPIPTCPSGGTYVNLLNCDSNVVCSANGNPSFEPADATPSSANGYHDMATVR
jgi:Tfp pilus assembly protein PilE